MGLLMQFLTVDAYHVLGLVLTCIEYFSAALTSFINQTISCLDRWTAGCDGRTKVDSLLVWELFTILISVYARFVPHNHHSSITDHQRVKNEGGHVYWFGFQEIVPEIDGFDRSQNWNRIQSINDAWLLSMGKNLLFFENAHTLLSKHSLHRKPRWSSPLTLKHRYLSKYYGDSCLFCFYRWI